jgi:hypothetical protein
MFCRRPICPRFFLVSLLRLNNSSKPRSRQLHQWLQQKLYNVCQYQRLRQHELCQLHFPSFIYFNKPLFIWPAAKLFCNLVLNFITKVVEYYIYIRPTSTDNTIDISIFIGRDFDYIIIYNKPEAQGTSICTRRRVLRIFCSTNCRSRGTTLITFQT